MKQTMLSGFFLLLLVAFTGCTSHRAALAERSPSSYDMVDPPATVGSDHVSASRVAAGEARPSLPQPVPVASVASAQEGAELSGRSRMLIWRGSINIEVSNISNAVARVTDIAQETDGYVENLSDSGDVRARLTLRVPASSLEPALASLGSIGKVTSRTISSQEVTEQYVDMEARLKTMIALRDRLRAVLDRAEKVTDILVIERELGRVQGNIDATQARLTSLRGRVQMASVSVTIQRRRILGPVGYLFKGTWWAVQKLFVIQE